jgi:hypothetical protein
MDEQTRNQQAHEYLECQRFNAELPLYLEGESGTRVERHAAQCGACRAQLNELRAIQAMARQLPEDSPSPAMWEHLHDMLASEGLIRSRRRAWLTWLEQLTLPGRLIPASVIAVLAVIGLLIITSSHPRNGRVNIAETSSAPSAKANYAVEEASVERTVTQMDRAYQSQLGSLDPAVREDYQRGIESLNHSIRECSETLQQAPENSLAREYLMQAYAQKAALLASALEYQGR